MRVGDDRPLVTGGGEQPPRPVVDAQRLGSAELDPAADGRAERQIGDSRCDVVGGDELDQPRRQSDGVAVGAGLDGLRQEIEELRRAQDRVGDAPGLDLASCATLARR